MKSSSFKLLSHLFTYPTSPPFNLSCSQLRIPHSHPHCHSPHHPSSLRAFSNWLPPPCRISSSLSRRNIWQTPKFPQRLVYPMDEYSIFPMLTIFITRMMKKIMKLMEREKMCLHFNTHAASCGLSKWRVSKRS